MKRSIAPAICVVAALLLAACAESQSTSGPSRSDINIVSSSHHREGAHRVIVEGRARNTAGIRANAVVVRAEVRGPQGGVLGSGSHTIGTLAPGETKSFRIVVTGVPSNRSVSHRAWVASARF